MPTVPARTRNDGRVTPQPGSGVLYVPPEQTAETVTLALTAGYRLTDTAQGHQNEESDAPISLASLSRRAWSNL